MVGLGVVFLFKVQFSIALAVIFDLAQNQNPPAITNWLIWQNFHGGGNANSANPRASQTKPT